MIFKKSIGQANDVAGKFVMRGSRISCASRFLVVDI
jgi:hypothetical protein